MSSGEVITEQRPVGRFDRIRLHPSAYGDLSITQAEEESLSIETEPSTMRRIETEVVEGELRIRMGGTWWERAMEALSSSINRRMVRYRVTVRELRRMEIAAAARATMPTLETDHLVLKLSGAGVIEIESLAARSLRVDLSGAGQVKLAGQVAEQEANLSGAGQYHGGKLESRRAKVNLSGVGDARVWATEELDMTLSGAGSISYYGSPRVRQKVSGLGRVEGLGDRTD